MAWIVNILSPTELHAVKYNWPDQRKNKLDKPRFWYLHNKLTLKFIVAFHILFYPRGNAPYMERIVIQESDPLLNLAQTYNLVLIFQKFMPRVNSNVEGNEEKNFTFGKTCSVIYFILTLCVFA